MREETCEDPAVRIWLGVVASLAWAGTALAADEGTCDTAKHLVASEVLLPRVAAAISKQHILKVVVLGTGSSILPPPAGEAAAYPARLEAALMSRLPAVAVKVVPDVKLRKTAAELKAEEFERITVDEKPALVVWQTGTVDAVRGIDPDDFRATLEKGVEALHANGADVIFVNMQYSPRTESMIAAAVYADNMRLAAMQQGVPLFDRFAIMKYWSELGTFDLHAASKNADTAARVHDCIGRLLAGLVVDASKAEPEPRPETR